MLTVTCAPTKIILSGKHFAVLGELAVVPAIDRRAHIQVKTKKEGRTKIKLFNPKLHAQFERTQYRQVG